MDIGIFAFLTDHTMDVVPLAQGVEELGFESLVGTGAPHHAGAHDRRGTRDRRDGRDPQIGVQADRPLRDAGQGFGRHQQDQAGDGHRPCARTEPANAGQRDRDVGHVLGGQGFCSASAQAGVERRPR